MKRWLSLLAAVVLSVAVGVTAFADEDAGRTKSVGIVRPGDTIRVDIKPGGGGQPGPARTGDSYTITYGSGTSAVKSGRSTNLPEILRGVEVAQLDGYSFQVDLPLLGFTGAKLDDLALTRGEDYTLREGGTVLTLTDSCVQSLSAGDHTLRMEFVAAVGTTSFTVESETADSGR